MKVVIYKPKTIYGLKFNCFWCGCEYVTDRDDMTCIYEDNTSYYESTCPICGAENRVNANTPFADYKIED